MGVRFFIDTKLHTTLTDNMGDNIRIAINSVLFIVMLGILFLNAYLTATYGEFKEIVKDADEARLMEFTKQVLSDTIVSGAVVPANASAIPPTNGLVDVDKIQATDLKKLGKIILGEDSCVCVGVKVIIIYLSLS